MTRTEKRQQTDEWEVEVCESCGHDASKHCDEPKIIMEGEPSAYTAIGCMDLVRENGRKIPNNPYLRCKCMKLV